MVEKKHHFIVPKNSGEISPTVCKVYYKNNVGLASQTEEARVS